MSLGVPENPIDKKGTFHESMESPDSYTPWNKEQKPLKIGHPKVSFIFQPPIFQMRAVSVPKGNTWRIIPVSK